MIKLVCPKFDESVTFSGANMVLFHQCVMGQWRFQRYCLNRHQYLMISFHFLFLSSLAFHLHWNLIYPITVGHSVCCSSLILSQQEENEEISSFLLLVSD
ncbi:hypothetical protein L2E82_40489 [Cichorium intybus]|uniref:Uncharacterized protein n=1 Tax=Cichorium intybus TaxID=13427 RepID=A0ACB9AM41_CICIN|nr:hypothetical protein L2E82_40489 [Cichorium intybus]